MNTDASVDPGDAEVCSIERCEEDVGCAAVLDETCASCGDPQPRLVATVASPDFAPSPFWTGSTLLLLSRTGVTTVDINGEVLRAESLRSRWWYSGANGVGDEVVEISATFEARTRFVLQHRDRTGAITRETEVDGIRRPTLIRTSEGYLVYGIYNPWGTVGMIPREGTVLLGADGTVLEDTPLWVLEDDRVGMPSVAVSVGEEIWVPVLRRVDRIPRLIEILRLDARGRLLSFVPVDWMPEWPHQLGHLAETEGGVLAFWTTSRDASAMHGVGATTSDFVTMLLGSDAQPTRSPRGLGFPGEFVRSWSVANTATEVLVAAVVPRLGAVALALLDADGELIDEARIQAAEGVRAIRAVRIADSFAIVYTTDDGSVWFQRVCLGRGSP